MTHRSAWRSVFASVVWLAGAARAVAAAPAPSPAPSAPARSEVKFTVDEQALLDWLKAATPFTFAVGNSLLKFDLTLSEPSDLRLLPARATLKIRLRGSGLDQVIQPVFTLAHDPARGRYAIVVQSLPVQMPGLGTIDLKDYFPRFEIPELLEDLYRFGERPVALNLDIRRIAVLEHTLEVGADVTFAPAPPPAARAAR